MAVYGVGPVPTARLLRVPLGEVRSAARSASGKLDRVAAIAAAGRMCEFRSRVIAADAAGEASDREARLARAHVQACVPCGRVYRRLRSEMRGREWQRAASAAFLPLPAVAFGRVGGLGKVAVWLEQRLSFIPRGSGGRAAEALGGAGLVKAAAAGTAIVAAGTALTGRIVHEITAPQSRPHAHIAQRAVRAGVAAAWHTSPESLVSARARGATDSSSRAMVHHSSPVAPSRSLGYLVLGGSSGGNSTPASSQSASPVRATAASVGQSDEGSSVEAAPPPSQSGGGTSLNYLGK